MTGTREHPPPAIAPAAHAAMAAGLPWEARAAFVAAIRGLIAALRAALAALAAPVGLR